MIPLPEVDFDISRPRMSLFAAALFFVRRGQSGPLLEEFDDTTIDPLFRLIEDESVLVTGIRAGDTVVEPVTGCWRTATVGDRKLAKRNYVYLEANPSEPLGSYVTRAGDTEPAWTHLEVLTSDMLRLVEDPPPDRAAVVSQPGSEGNTGEGGHGHGVAIEKALEALWPEGVPKGLSVQERNNALFCEMRRQGTTTKTAIHSVTFRRFFQKRSS